jgi:hypothetical protein
MMLLDFFLVLLVGIALGCLARQVWGWWQDGS